MDAFLDAINEALAASPIADIVEAVGCFFLGC